MAEQIIRLKQGDAHTVTETITGIDSLSGYSAKLYVKDEHGAEVLTKAGSIASLVITYSLLNDDTKDITKGEYYFETKIWNASDNVFTPSEGRFIVEEVLEEDPS